MDNILVIGATGFLGSRICKRLFFSGYNVYAGIRRDSSIDHIRDWIVHALEINLHIPPEEAVIQELVEKNITHIIFAAGGVNYKSSYKAAYHQNVIPCENSISLALELQKRGYLKKAVFIGSVASRGFSSETNTMINENTDLLEKGKSVYCDIKRECEDTLRLALSRDGLKGIIVEPGSLVGTPLGGKTTTTVGLIKKILKKLPVLKGGASYTSLEQTAEGIKLALERGKIGETYLLGGENLPMKDFAELVKKSGKIAVLPGFLANSISFFGIMINKQQALLGQSFHYIDSSKAKNELGYTHSREDLLHEISGITRYLIENQ